MKLKNEIIKEFKNKTILVTGGTGSIGLGITKQLLKCNTKAIRILTNDENSIFEAKRNLGENAKLTFMVGDVRDKDRLELAIRNVDIVFHAAAMKHIDICEENPFDAVKTNVIGTSNILEASLLENVSKFILISTDKSTNPTTTLGASKLLAERLTLNANAYTGQGKTIFSVVRFGNVIGSRGSVFQIFLNQIRNNKPLTVTDRKMTRYIMSISDAAMMILKVTKITKDGEIFILKMPSVKIEDLAKAMIQVYKKEFQTKNFSKIKFSNSREHERLDEFLITEEERMFCHDIKDMYKISKNINKKILAFEKFNSKTAPSITQIELKRILSELIKYYLN